MTASNEIQVEDIEYLRHGDKPLLARIYRPRGNGPFPGVVEVHGGAWTQNDRTTNGAIHEPLARSGAVVMAIDFRMPPEVTYPAALADINFAIRWLKHHAHDFNVRPALVGGLGTSSGGHQIMVSALRPYDPRYASLPLPDEVADARLAFVALCWPINNPLARYRMVKANGNTRLAQAHEAYWPDEAAMEDANPQLILERGEKVTLPPVLLIQGLRDDNVTPDMADRFAASYRAAGGPIELHKFADQPHAFIARDPAAPDAVRAVETIVDFIRRQAS
jgi:acetyl esterase/lipase